MELIYRFLLGGLIISVFAAIADAVRPKGFAGLFGAAPSVALATLALTVMSEGKLYAAVEAKSMITGAVAFLLYAMTCVYFIGMRHARAAHAAIGLLGVWVAAALGLWMLYLR